MIDVLTPVLAGLAGLAVVWTLVLIILDRPIDTLAFWMLAVLEFGLVVLTVAGIVGLIQTDRDISGPVFIAYLIAIPLILPAAVFWGLAERTRAGTAVVLVAALSMPALMLRVHALWTGTA